PNGCQRSILEPQAPILTDAINKAARGAHEDSAITWSNADAAKWCAFHRIAPPEPSIALKGVQVAISRSDIGAIAFIYDRRAHDRGAPGSAPHDMRWRADWSIWSTGLERWRAAL